MTKVLVFGTFDGLHPGHLAFLKQARELGEELIVSVAQDEIVERLKQRMPVQTMQARRQALEATPQVTKTYPGDLIMGAYTGFRELKPNVVAFGYDQNELLADFKRFQQQTGDETPTVVLKPYHPEKYKSSILRSD